MVCELLAQLVNFEVAAESVFTTWYTTSSDGIFLLSFHFHVELLHDKVDYCQHQLVLVSNQFLVEVEL